MIEAFYREFYDRISRSNRDAYVHYGERYSYAQMHDNILCINSVLKSFQRANVGIYAKKSFLNYSAIAATLLSNNIWIPFNPEIPDARNLEMMSLARPSVILTDEPLPEVLGAFAAMHGIQVEQLSSLVEGEAKGGLDVAAMQAGDVAMIYFTSGSTGVPKGVPLTHENYIINVRNILRLLPLREGEVFADYHDLAFVISVPIFFPCVMTESAIAPATSRQDMMLPMKNLTENKVSVFITVPSTLARIRQMNKDGLADCHLNVLIMCGEPFHLDLLDYAANKLRPNCIFNFYGSTEVAPWTFCQRCEASDVARFAKYGMVPIGAPIEGNDIEISEEDELCVAGAQITPGYLGGVSAEKFYEKDGKRWYATGDKVVVDNGLYVCKGRLDSQVKIGGYRIELSDIEAHLRGVDGVDAAICFVSGEDPAKTIVAVLHSDREIALNEVRAHLKDKLPHYMIPRKVVTLAKMPLNKSGKIDRALLKEAHA
ncbi:MAG: AMP-binding protein [Proteobacteria bacterium]|nr:AMP-binding protein [Pseudomonadota bacterium]